MARTRGSRAARDIYHHESVKTVTEMLLPPNETLMGDFHYIFNDLAVTTSREWPSIVITDFPPPPDFRRQAP
jgi:hypothetical protein